MQNHYRAAPPQELGRAAYKEAATFFVKFNRSAAQTSFQTAKDHFDAAESLTFNRHGPHRSSERNRVALAGSLFIATARCDGRLVGMLRLVGDGAYILRYRKPLKSWSGRRESNPYGQLGRRRRAKSCRDSAILSRQHDRNSLQDSLIYRRSLHRDRRSSSCPSGRIWPEVASRSGHNRPERAHIAGSNCQP